MAKLKTGRHTSAIKASRQSERRASRNRGVQRKIRQTAKDLLAAAAKKDTDSAQKLLPAVASVWDKAAKRGIVHWKAAARMKSRLAKRVNTLTPKTNS